MSLTHQECVEELVAQIDGADDRNSPIIQFLLELDETKELVLTDVKFNDGVIECRMAIF